MAGMILTPKLIWKNFKVKSDFKTTDIKEENNGGVISKSFYLNGKSVKDGTIKIYCESYSNEKQSQGPAIILLNDFYSAKEEGLINNLVKSGYLVLVVDVAGKTENKEFFTIYPKSLSFANLEVAKKSLYTIEDEAQDSCWYEWACVVRYVLSYLKDQKQIAKVGGFGVGEVATALWEVAGAENQLDCAVFALNAGWLAYRGQEKFSGKVEPQHSDNVYKFIAGIDSQSYATHVNCPSLVLSSTNSSAFDVDRAFDTVARIPENVYSAINYSIDSGENIGYGAFKCAMQFLDNFLSEQPKGLPSDIDIKCELVDGKIKVVIKADENDLKEVSLYVSEETVKPSKRSWAKITECIQKNEEGYLFEYVPYRYSNKAMFFAIARYKSGYEIGSAIVSKKFSEEDVAFSYKSNIIYSSRHAGAESVFVCAKDISKTEGRIAVSDKNNVKVKKGPMNIYGVGCDSGLATFKINASKDMPSDNSLLIFDVYSKEKGLITVRLVTDYYGAKTEYLAWINVLGGEVWQNVKVELIKFKTETGMPLRSFSSVEAIEFISEESTKFLINNALWV